MNNILDTIEKYAGTAAIWLLYGVCWLVWTIGICMLVFGIWLFFYSLYHLVTIFTAHNIDEVVGHLFGLLGMAAGGGIVFVMIFACIDGLRSLQPKKFFTAMAKANF